MSSNFKPLSTRNFCPNEGPGTSPDEEYWNSFSFPVTAKELGTISYIDYAPAESQIFAASTSAKVQLYSTIQRKVHTSISRFHDSAYGGSFRKDGKLLVAGTEQGRIRLFDVERKAQLRIFTGHKAATHLCRFCNNLTQAVSFSDDKSSIVWDVSNEDVVMKYEEHEDYIRTGAVNQSCSNTFISGSYDHKVKMFDMRAPKSTMQVDHGVPVESVLFFPSGNVFVSAGGTEIKVWDVLAGGKLIASLSQHHKTVTCLALASNNRRLLSGSLDKNVKIFSTETYQVVHTLNYPSSILSLGISSTDDSLAVGMMDGLLSMQLKKKTNTKPRSNKRINTSFESMFDPPPTFDGQRNDRRKKSRFTNIERHLKSFEPTKALDEALNNDGKPEVTVALIQELIRNDQILTALGGRDERSLMKLFTFITKNIKIEAFARVIIDFAIILIDIYSDTLSRSDEMRVSFLKLRKQVKDQMELVNQEMSLSGTIDLLLATAAKHPDTTSPLDSRTSEALPGLNVRNDDGSSIDAD